MALSSFRSRLARLGPPGPGASASPPPLALPSPLASSDEAPPSIDELPTPLEDAAREAADGAAGGAADGATDGATEPAPALDASPQPPSIDDLRDKIARILARERPRAAPSDPTRGELPFLRVETAAGPLYRRVLPYVNTHRMGRFSVNDAHDADAAMLALLALDPAIAPLDPRGFLYIDTETTGLAGGTGTVPFLIGMARFEEREGGKALVLEQVLLRQLGEEGPMLERFLAEARRATAYVSYNGKSFDIPLLRTRLVMNRMPPLPELPHLDLVHLARRVHQKRLGACRLVQVEQQVLGFVREHDVPSGEVVARYRHFLRTGDDSSLLGVVEHNAWDIMALAALVGIYGAPLVALGSGDLVGVSRTLRRSKALGHADAAAHEAVSQGGGAEALRERAEVARARGERDRAVSDLELVVASVDDPTARLTLAKLYEHHVKKPSAALAVSEQGTGEAIEQAAKRQARLRKKIEKQAQQSLPGAAKPRARRPRKPGAQ
jgi:uncharacterized protein